MNDIEVILKTLTRERDDLHQQLMQVDRIIKRVKGSTFQEPAQHIIRQEPKKLTVPLTSNDPMNMKLLVLRVFDIIGRAAKLNTIQTEYNKISGNKYSVRDIVRSLHKSTLLKSIREVPYT